MFGAVSLPELLVLTGFNQIRLSNQSARASLVILQQKVYFSYVFLMDVWMHMVYSCCVCINMSLGKILQYLYLVLN